MEGKISMTKEQLESYQSKVAEIAELQYKLQHMSDSSAMIEHDTILDYRKGYPVPRAVVGINLDKYQKRRQKYNQKIDILTKECEEIENFVEEITDSLTRRILRMYYLEGRSQYEISKRVHISQSNISKKISFFLKLE